MESDKHNSEEYQQNQNYSANNDDQYSEYSEEEDLDQMEEIIENEDDMEIEDEDDHEGYNSDADTFNTSSHPIYLNYLESQYVFHNDAILSLALNPVDKNEFITGGMDDQIAIWSMKDESATFTQKFKESINNVAFSYDGSLVAFSILDNQIKVFKRQENNQFVEKATFTGFDDEISVKLLVFSFSS